MGGGNRGLWATYAALAMCFAAVSVAWLLVRREPDSTGPAASEAEAMRPLDAAAGLLERGEDTTADSFLEDLSSAAGAPPDEGSDTGLADAPAVCWEETGDMARIAARVLEEYRGQGFARVASSGYLDLSGVYWGALIEDARGWVDVVLVVSYETTEDGSERCEVHIARLAGDA